MLPKMGYSKQHQVLEPHLLDLADILKAGTYFSRRAATTGDGLFLTIPRLGKTLSCGDLRRVEIIWERGKLPDFERQLNQHP